MKVIVPVRSPNAVVSIGTLKLSTSMIVAAKVEFIAAHPGPEAPRIVTDGFEAGWKPWPGLATTVGLPFAMPEMGTEIEIRVVFGGREGETQV